MKCTHFMSSWKIASQNLNIAPARVVIKVKGHQHRWLAGGYDLEIGHF